MNFADVKQLAGLMSEHNLSSLTYEDGEFKLSFSKAPLTVAEVAIAPSAAVAASAELVAENTNHVIVTAPVVGTAYRAREAGASPIVSVGDSIAKGDVLCIIEAMKVFSEITAPCAGKIVEIPFTDGALAEFGAKLVIIDPTE